MKIPLSSYENAWDMIKRDAVGTGPVLVLVAHDCDAIAACRTLQVHHFAEIFPFFGTAASVLSLCAVFIVPSLLICD